MPSTYAHKRFGEKVLSALPEPLSGHLKKHLPEYYLGLHGPDLLFYYRPLGKNAVNGKGYKMHEERRRAFSKGRAKPFRTPLKRRAYRPRKPPKAPISPDSSAISRSTASATAISAGGLKRRASGTPPSRRSSTAPC